MSARLTQRPFTSADAQRVCAFLRSPEELFHSVPKAVFPLTPEQLMANAASRQGSTVVLLDGEVVGYANFFQIEPGRFCTLGNLMTDHGCRGQGVGSFLVRRMETKAREEWQAREARVACFSPNVAGLLLYAKLGYAPAAIEPRMGWRGERTALIHMAKPL